MTWQPIETAPAEEQVIFWVGGRWEQVVFGRVVEYSDGERKYAPSGWHGDFPVTHWMPIPEPPK